MREPDLADMDDDRLGKSKSLRAIHAILRTGYDPLTKMVLVVYAMGLNTKRTDYGIWLSLKTLSEYSSVGRTTVVAIHERLIEDGVLHKWSKPHHLQKKNKAGRYSVCYSLVVLRLESLAKKFAVSGVRPSRGRHQAEAQRVIGLKRKAQEAREKAAHVKEERIKRGLDEDKAYGDRRTGEIFDRNETLDHVRRRAEDEAGQAAADLKGDLAGAKYRLEILKRDVEERRQEWERGNAKPRNREDDPQDLSLHSARSMYDDAMQAVRAHIKAMNQMEREAKAPAKGAA